MKGKVTWIDVVAYFSAGVIIALVAVLASHVSLTVVETGAEQTGAALHGVGKGWQQLMAAFK
jgi:hypothetical protein